MPVIPWTADDTRAVLQNVIASVLLIVVADIIVRGILSVAFGSRPRLKVAPAPPKAMTDVDWPHVRVTNAGLRWSPRTRAAERVTAYGKLDGRDVRFQWSTTDEDPPAQVDIYGDRSAEIPIAARAVKNVNVSLLNNDMQAGVAHLTETEFLTQGHLGKPGPHPLSTGDHALEVTVQALDGSRTTTNFKLTVPPSPGKLELSVQSNKT